MRTNEWIDTYRHRKVGKLQTDKWQKILKNGETTQI